MDGSENKVFCSAEYCQKLKEQLDEAKRLLKAAIKVINENCDGFCEYCKYYTKFNLSSCELGIDVCENNNQWEWKYEAKALKLLGEDGKPKDNNMNFCPRCGAKMDAEPDEPWQSE